MKKFNLIFILALLLGIFVFPTRALASTDPLNHVKNDLPQEELMNKDSKDVENKGKVLNFKEEKSKKLLMQNPVGGTQKTFTVTKRAVGNTEDGTLVGNYDTFYEAVENCKQEDLTNEYVITMNSDYTIPETEAMWGKSKVNMVLRSKVGNQFTLKRSNKNFGSLFSGTTLKIEKVILDGSNSAQAFGITGGTLTLGKGAVVQNCTEYTGFDGPAIYLNGGTLNVLEGAIIQNNKYSLQGGAIQARNDSTVNISGGIFRNNNAKRGGGAIAAFGPLDITGGTFENNETGVTGGAIIIGRNYTASISNATFKGNKASTGGAIYSSKEFSVSKTTFENNTANWGGAIFASKKLTIDETTFKNNKVDSAGGALYLQGGAEIKNSTFTENSAKVSGGAIYCKNLKLDLDGTTFTENSSVSDGGAVYSVDADVDIDNCTFEKNENKDSEARGGALLLGVQYNPTVNYTIKNSTIKNNKSKNIGGGITAILGTLTIENSNIEANNSDLLGGGIVSVAQTIVNLNKCIIKNNTANGAAGIFVGTGGSQIKGTVNIKGTEFNGNDTGSKKEQKALAGGGIYIDEGVTVNISDSSKFIDNKAGFGGAIYNVSSDYKNPADETKYKNLSIDKTTLFKGNEARLGLFAPPINYDKFDKLKFSDTSDIPHMKGMSKSLLNNYDINYKGDFLIAYDANGGKFEDGKAEKTENHKDNDGITISAAPVREGYKFTGWKGTKVTSDAASAKEVTLKPGDKFTIDGNYIFAAQWEKIESKVKDKGYLGTFTIKSPDEFKKKIESHKAYLAGYLDQKVLPEGKMTRAEAVALISRLEGYDLSDSSSRIFSDLKEGSWYNKYINAAFEKGILVEKSGQDFRPDSPITRAEFAKLIEFIDKKNNSIAPFADVKGHIYEDAINQAYGNNRIAGYPDGTFRPDAPITRAEIVTILNNFYDRKADAKSLEGIENLGLLKHFTDLNENHWAYYEIMEAANSHECIRRNENGIVENWIRLIEDMVK